MTDPITQEQRRLSAAWLNIIAASLASAGLLPWVNLLVTQGWTDATARVGLVALACTGASFAIHLVARRLLR